LWREINSRQSQCSNVTTRKKEVRWTICRCEVCFRCCAIQPVQHGICSTHAHDPVVVEIVGRYFPGRYASIPLSCLNLLHLSALCWYCFVGLHALSHVPSIIAETSLTISALLKMNFIIMQELLAIQQNGAKNIGFFGTRNMGFLHQKLVEILSYAMVLTGNHIYTSGGTGTNAAVIRGALRAEMPELLTVILPQSLERQPEELHELLSSVQQLITMPENDKMTLLEASRCGPSLQCPLLGFCSATYRREHVLSSFGNEPSLC
jgi:hypothetical protein